MLTKKIFNIGLVLLIVLGFFSNIHSAERLSDLSSCDSDSELPQFKKSSNNLGLDSNTSLIHTCHVGHSGCCFNFPSSIVFSDHANTSSDYILLPEISYASPDQKLLKRPPIS